MLWRKGRPREMESGWRGRHLSRRYEGRERVTVDLEGAPGCEDSLGSGLEVGVPPVCPVKATSCGNG